MTSYAKTRRVVVTGMGVVCPLGMTKESLWEALSTGRSGVGAYENPSAEVMRAPYAAAAREFSGKIDDFGTLDAEQKKAIRKAIKIMCRECQMGVAAAQRAIGDAGLSPGKFEPERFGVVFGSDYMLTEPDELVASVLSCMDDSRNFHFSRWAEQGMGKMFPLWLLKYLPNMPASHIAIYNDLRGPNNSLTLREAAAGLAVGEAFRVIVGDRADRMVAGATGTRMHPMKAIHATLQEELAGGEHSAEATSRPFDLDRTGMVLGEGAGAVVLEELEHARARGATIYGEIVAASSATSADRRGVADRRKALGHVLRGLIREGANGDPNGVGHVQAHGVSTQTCDADEAGAIADAFRGRSKAPPVTAAKSYFGNLGAGSGVVELIAGLLSLSSERLYPLLNFTKADPACPISPATNGVSPGGSFVQVNVTPQGQASGVMARAF